MIISGQRTISASQIKAARALLDWTQEDLAGASGLSIATIRKLELGNISPRQATTQVLCKALENAGIDLLDRDGLRRKSDEICTYQGMDGIKSFFEDVKKTLAKSNGEVLIVEKSDASLYELCGQRTHERLTHILDANPNAHIKCILLEISDIPLSSPRLEFRSISRNYIDIMPFFVFGDKCALININQTLPTCILVLQSTYFSQNFRKLFDSIWEKTTSLYQTDGRILNNMRKFVLK